MDIVSPPRSSPIAPSMWCGHAWCRNKNCSRVYDRPLLTAASYPVHMASDRKILPGWSRHHDNSSRRPCKLKIFASIAECLTTDATIAHVATTRYKHRSLLPKLSISCSILLLPKSPPLLSHLQNFKCMIPPSLTDCC